MAAEPNLRRASQESDTDPEDNGPSPCPPIRDPPDIEALKRNIRSLEPANALNVDLEIKSLISDFVPIIDRDYSLEPDYRLGGKPTHVEGTPIPLRFDYEDGKISYALEDLENDIIYRGYRPQDSLHIHESFCKRGTYPFQFPSKSLYMLFDVTREKLARKQNSRPKAMCKESTLKFDSFFEGGNLDLAVRRPGDEYDLYMRTDSNNRGHHQWFFYSVKNSASESSTAKFSILNFTKKDSLYEQGMRVAIFSESKARLAAKGELPSVYKGWHRGGNNISYKVSKLTQCLFQKARIARTYYSLSFEYTFEYPDDKVYFAYSEPYTFTQLTSLIAEVSKTSAKLTQKDQFLREEVLCKSISGVSIPLLTITSHINSERSEYVESEAKMLWEIVGSEALTLGSLDPEGAAKFMAECEARLKAEKKKVLIVTARIHPGETCGSFVMEGFLRFITSSDPAAVELRNKMILKVIPMVNPDGVIIGNYRGCLSGHDLNRRFSTPNPHLHPGICAIKKLLRDLKTKECDIFGYIDLHGHSKKKCVFIHGPYYPLHSERYVRVRILAKLLAERTQMFRYQACKYRQEPDKMSAARFVISREFSVMNSLTLESSFYGFINAERKTIEFCATFYQRMGLCLAQACEEYSRLIEEEFVRKLRRTMCKRRKKILLVRARRTHKPRGLGTLVGVLNKSVAGITNVGSTTTTVLQNRAGMEGVRVIQPAPLPDYELTDPDPLEETQNPNEPTDKKVIRLEDCFENPDLFLSSPAPQYKNLADLCNIIQNESVEEEEEQSGSSSSEGDILTGEEEALVINNILSTIAGFSTTAVKLKSSSPALKGTAKVRSRDDEAGRLATIDVDACSNKKERRTVYTSPGKKTRGKWRASRTQENWIAKNQEESPQEHMLTMSMSKATRMKQFRNVNRWQYCFNADPQLITPSLDKYSPMNRSTATLNIPAANNPNADYTISHQARHKEQDNRPTTLSRCPAAIDCYSNIPRTAGSRLRPRNRKEGFRVNYFNAKVPSIRDTTVIMKKTRTERLNSFHGLLTVTSYNLKDTLSVNVQKRVGTSEGRGLRRGIAGRKVGDKSCMMSQKIRRCFINEADEEARRSPPTAAASSSLRVNINNRHYPYSHATLSGKKPASHL